MSTPKPKASPTNSAAKALIALGFDERQRPRGARFTDANPNLVAKAAKLMDLNVYEAGSDDLAEVAKKLPIGRLYANGRGFVPNIRQQLHSKVIAALASESQGDPDDPMPAAAPGLPQTWAEIAQGHLVIAQESLENGWWEAIVIECKDDMLTIRFRDYPKLPKFYRHRTAVALMHSGA
jgi:hypothetical protein